MKYSQQILEYTCITNQKQTSVKSLYIHESNMRWIYTFFQTDRFLYFILNTVERHIAFGQRSFWISNNSDYSTMTKNDVDDFIKGGGEPLK